VGDRPGADRYDVTASGVSRALRLPSLCSDLPSMPRRAILADARIEQHFGAR